MTPGPLMPSQTGEAHWAFIPSPAAMMMTRTTSSALCHCDVVCLN